LIFVCHSLGGLVSTRALLHAEESGDSLYKDVANSTVGFLFLGTPFRGSQIANWGKLGTDFIRVTSDVNRDIVTLLKPDSEILFQLRISFVNLLRKRAQNSNGGIIVKTIFEELGMTLIGKVSTWNRIPLQKLIPHRLSTGPAQYSTDILTHPSMRTMLQ
jgi:hypothetical protein